MANQLNIGVAELSYIIYKTIGLYKWITLEDKENVMSWTHDYSLSTAVVDTKPVVSKIS